MNDTYKTLAGISEGVFKDKGSKFIAYAYPVTGEEAIQRILEDIRKKHHKARHHCYAWRLGTEEIHYRANDDGEPSSTAGKPILGQLLSNDLTNVVVVVVRYFGGTLLGTSGLIQAYKKATAEAIRNNKILVKKIETTFEIRFAYSLLNEVMQIIKSENLNPVFTDFSENCLIRVTVRKGEEKRMENTFTRLVGAEVKKISG
jgi:uncharacterized YigZ family protein